MVPTADGNYWLMTDSNLVGHHHHNFSSLAYIFGHPLLILGKDLAVVDAVQVEQLSNLVGRTGLQQKDQAMLGTILHFCRGGGG